MDRRDRYAEFGDYPKGTRLDQGKMILYVPLLTDLEEGEEADALEKLGDEDGMVAFPCRYEVCDLCHGKGKHVNPSIDAHGITPDEFAEDPDFAESYFNGEYDQDCNSCHGKRVVPEIIRDNPTPELAAKLKLLDDWFKGMREMYSEMEAERRFGC